MRKIKVYLHGTNILYRATKATALEIAQPHYCSALSGLVRSTKQKKALT